MRTPPSPTLPPSRRKGPKGRRMLGAAAQVQPDRSHLPLLPAPPGRSGGPWDMGRGLQAAARKNPQGQAAGPDARAAGAGDKALFVWNGDWIRSNGQDGGGLAAVREAIMWEVGFAPEACRVEPVH